MSGLVTTAIIVGIFFAIGIIVGVISVIAMAAIRTDRKRELPGPQHGPPGSEHGPPGPNPPTYPDPNPNPDPDHWPDLSTGPR